MSSSSFNCGAPFGNAAVSAAVAHSIGAIVVGERVREGGEMCVKFIREWHVRSD